ncbi:hypothetical protein ACEQ8H_005302 [Pleosporales sp. CAS-2024a]
MGVPGGANKTFCYAHLALEAVLAQLTHDSPSQPNAPPPTELVVQGCIVPGHNWEQLRTRVHQFSKNTPLQVTKDIRVADRVDAR